MRWKYEKEPSVNSTKTVRKFLWLPLKIGYETRWLEYASITYIWRPVKRVTKYGYTFERNGWDLWAWDD